MPINQSRVASASTPNMGVAPVTAWTLANKAQGGMGTGLLSTVGKAIYNIAQPTLNPASVLPKTPAPVSPPAPGTFGGLVAPGFGGLVAPGLLTPKTPPPQKTIPQNPPPAPNLALAQLQQENANLAKYGTATNPNAPAPTAPAATTGSGLTQQQEQAASDAKTGTKTTTDAQAAAYTAAQTRAANLQALQDRYTASLGQSPEEIAVQQQLDNIAASKDLGVQAASEQPIEMGFITGQQKNMTERASAQSVPLQAKLAAMQAARTASSTQAKAAYDEATGNGENKPTAVGGNLVQLNPTTGKYEAVYSAPNDTTTLSEGQTLVDKATGKTIATGSDKTAAPTSDISNYDYAKQSGYTGSFMDYMQAKNPNAIDAAGNINVTNDDGSTTNISSAVAPYYNTSHSGVGYIDASTLQGTASEKTAIINEATKEGLKVITNKNTAADITNIKDAYSKLDTIGKIFAGIAQPEALARDLYGAGLTSLASMAQTDPQKAAAGALQSVGLDILKAISGIQGFRGNSSAIQQVTSHLPSIYDTTDVVNQKIDYINKLISDREDAIVGKGGSTSGGSSGGTVSIGSSQFVQDANGNWSVVK